MASIQCTIDLHPAVLFRNILPVDIVLCVESIREETNIKAGDTSIVRNVDPGSSSVIVRVRCVLNFYRTQTCVRIDERYLSKIVQKQVIVFQIPGYLEREWSCRREVNSNPAQFTVWSFDSHTGTQTATLDLGMHVLPQGGSLLMSLYCPFWMLNKTNLNLGYRVSCHVAQ